MKYYNFLTCSEQEQQLYKNQQEKTDYSVPLFLYNLQYIDGIFINTGVLHAYSEEKNIKTMFLNVLFMPSFIYGTKESIFWTNYQQPLTKSIPLSYIVLPENLTWQKELLNNIKQVISLFKQKEFGYEFAVRSHLSNVTLLICKNSLQIKELEDNKNKIEEHNKIAIERIRKMLAFIEQHYMNLISLQQIADSAYISNRKCSRLFQNIVGTNQS